MKKTAAQKTMAKAETMLEKLAMLLDDAQNAEGGVDATDRARMSELVQLVIRAKQSANRGANPVAEAPGVAASYLAEVMAR